MTSFPGVCACTTVHVERSKASLSWHSCGFGDQSQVVRLSNKCLSLMCHLARPTMCLTHSLKITLYKVLNNFVPSDLGLRSGVGLATGWCQTRVLSIGYHSPISSLICWWGLNLGSRKHYTSAPSSAHPIPVLRKDP